MVSIMLIEYSIWVSSKHLIPYQPQKQYLLSATLYADLSDHPYDDDNTKLEKKRHVAFLRDVLLDKNDEYWVNYINETKRSRRVSTNNGLSCGKGERGHPPLIDLDSYDSPIIKRKRSTSLHNDQDASPSHEAATLRVFQKRARLTQMSSDMLNIRIKNQDWFKGLPKNPSVCTIFVGQERKPFQVGLSRVKACANLAPRLKGNANSGLTIDLSPADVSDEPRGDDGQDPIELSLAEFLPVFRYMQGDDAAITQPYYATSSGSGSPESQTIDDDAQNLADHYTTAAKLGYVELQTRLAKRIQTLPALRPKTVLAMGWTLLHTQVWGAEAEAELHRWLVQNVSRHFRQMQMQCNKALWRLLDASWTLRKAVLEPLIGMPGEGDLSLDPMSLMQRGFAVGERRKGLGAGGE